MEKGKYKDWKPQDDLETQLFSLPQQLMHSVRNIQRVWASASFHSMSKNFSDSIWKQLPLTFY